jgi:hypothetical protein
MPAGKDTILYNMRFSKEDHEYYQKGLELAKKRRISLAELLRQLLIKELDNEGMLTKEGLS